MFKNKKIKFFLSFILLLSIFFIVKTNLILASDTDILGVEKASDELILKAVDPREIVVRIINIALSLLGIIAVSLIIYGGFLWMTSEGNEERISKAKGILKGAVIGLIIILAAWGIVAFIFSSLFPGGQSSSNNNSPNINPQIGLGAIGNCSLSSVYPQPDQKNIPRNTVIMATFKEPVYVPSFSEENVIVCNEDNFNFDDKSCSVETEFSVSASSDQKTFIIFPESDLGNESGPTDYVVYFSSDILKADQSFSIFASCSIDYFLWNFGVSNLLDLTPPKIESIFPQKDNDRDTVSQSSSLANAKATFLMGASSPKSFQAAGLLPIVATPQTTTTADIVIDPNYNGEYTSFTVVIDSTASNKARLGSGTNSLGIFDINNNSVDFTNYFKMNFSSTPSAGNQWTVSVKKRVLADTISVGSYTYTFVSGQSSAYNIKTITNPNLLAQEIALVLSANPLVNAISSSTVVNLSAKIGGTAGNNINISSSNTNSVNFTNFSGGSDNVEIINVNGIKDKPMNSIIQINFNEVVNPITVSGSSDELKNFIRVVNKASGSKNNAEACALDSDCKSFSCLSGFCVGNELKGDFSISSNYKTVEFKSKNKCGINGCGEDIFCLPPSSNIAVELVAAELFDCEVQSGLNCSNKSPFSSCTQYASEMCRMNPNSGSCAICINDQGQRYPLADMNNLNGIIDASGNSFDGNSDSYSFGPVSYYNKNNAHNPNTGDNFVWSFWTNNKIETSPPFIDAIYPEINASAADLVLPIKIDFNKLMMISTLKTGQIILNNGNQEVVHRLINLISGQLVGYWIGSENKDVSPVDGEPDKTSAFIEHARFFEGSDYKPQIGSGVKDIYQNCFKPSAGLNCNAILNPVYPYCCNGVQSSSPCN